VIGLLRLVDVAGLVEGWVVVGRVGGRGWVVVVRVGGRGWVGRVGLVDVTRLAGLVGGAASWLAAPPVGGGCGSSG
jgi:hypothetical protein